MIKVLGIAGSPRKSGNSELLLDSFLAGAKSAGLRVEKINISDFKIAPCDEGNSCHKSGVCRIKDDMQWIYLKLLNTDHMVVSTPTFFMGPPAQLKALVDRCQALWARKFLLKKPLRDVEKDMGKKHNGFLIATAGLADKKEAFTGARNTIKAFYYVLGFRYKGEIFFGGVDDKGDIQNIKGALDKAFKAGTRINT